MPASSPSAPAALAAKSAQPAPAVTAGPAALAATSAPAVLVARGLAKSVATAAGQRRQLFSGVDLDVAAGDVVAITGESGVGKSTLLNILAGLDQPDAGHVAISGQPLAGLDEAATTALRCRAIGFVFQAFHVLPHLDLARNVALPLVLAGVAQAPALAAAQAMLAQLGLAGRGSDHPAVLSGGELQRVAIARALVHRPALVLADEPTGNLDPDTARRILDLLLASAADAGSAVLIVTHSDAVAQAAGRALRLAASGLAPDPRPRSLAA
ncbi:MAG: ABC transporter ATP-binding protein [Alphaproteobacteria bacterium]|nr:ABC transporter ATP-binding protein [Alphaproteobacteria bacterium]